MGIMNGLKNRDNMRRFPVKNGRGGLKGPSGMGKKDSSIKKNFTG
jgi:hypothetical protein